MELDLNIIKEKLSQNEFVKKFINELSQELQKNDNKFKEDIKLTDDEELEFERKEFDFLQKYFEKELSDLSKGETYIVTDKYENDNEYHRYKITQYKDNFECKYVAFEKDLPSNIQIRDIIRKINGNYIYDEDATKFIKDNINKIKQNIIKNRT